jgi:hypothetical protein
MTRVLRDGVLALIALGVVALLIGPHIAKKLLLVGSLVYAAAICYGLYLRRAKQPRPTPEPPAVV